MVPESVLTAPKGAAKRKSAFCGALPDPDLFLEGTAAHHIIALGVGGEIELAVIADLRLVGRTDQAVVGAVVGVKNEVGGVHAVELTETLKVCALFMTSYSVP